MLRKYSLCAYTVIMWLQLPTFLASFFHNATNEKAGRKVDGKPGFEAREGLGLRLGKAWV